MNLYFLLYNNYYNRIIKKENTLEDYLQYLVGDVDQNINFIPNDDLTTEIISNRPSKDIGNYVLAVDNNEIVSRWFIISSVRQLNGQYRIALKRDVVADNYNLIINAPCFVEKATLNNDDPMIFNSENMSFNQIKTDETPLKDGTGIPWIVGYYAKTTGTNDEYTQLSGTVGEIANPDLISEAQTIEDDYLYKDYSNFKSLTPDSVMYNIFIDADRLLTYYKVNVNAENAYSTNIARPAENMRSSIKANYSLNTRVPSGIQSNIDFANFFEQIRSYYDYTPTYTVDEILNYNGKIIKTQDGKFHKIRVDYEPYDEIVDITIGILFNELSTAVATQSAYLSGNPNEYSFKMELKGRKFKLSFEEIPLSSSTYNIGTARYHLEDAPYDMFAIPYGEITIKNTNGSWTSLEVNPTTSLSIAQAISSKYSGTYLYDIQLLPYCPVSNLLQSDGSLDVLNDDYLYSLVINTTDKSNVGIIFNCSRSSGTFNIPSKIVVKDPKIESECDMYRLCSPNFNGQFEFNVAKNGGVNFFNVDYTYKPFSPYIHINPDFKLLYGKQDFNDARGLVCGGDFSLPIIKDNWNAYEIQNKNYQNIFDRQIQNMEISQEVQRINQIAGIVSGSIGGLIGGGIAGSLLGKNPSHGGLIGGVLGGAASAVGGAVDYSLSEKLRNEAIDYTKDQFGYQLGNIKALPDSLTRTSAYTYNNKIFPILEYYTCTDEEREALKNKIHYNGMTVMRIGTISEFLKPEPSYIKGKIIRIEGLEGGFNLLNEISNEINKGVFI